MKNSVAIHKVLSNILLEKKGTLPLDFGSWMKYHEFQSKTVSLILHCLTGQPPTVPVDRHVFHFFQATNLSNAKNTEELAYQLHYFIDEEDYIKVNDNIGCLAQLAVDPKGRFLISKELEKQDAAMKDIIQPWLLSFAK